MAFVHPSCIISLSSMLEVGVVLVLFVASLFSCHGSCFRVESSEELSGIIGYVIVDKDATIVNTTLDTENAISLAAMVIKVGLACHRVTR